MALMVNDPLPFSVGITDAAGQPANAGTVTLTVTHPDGTAYAGSPFTITPVATGQYEKVDLTATMAGRYVGKWVATGQNASAHTEVFHIRSGDETAIVSLDEVKEHLGKSLTTSTSDQELERKIGAATLVVEKFSGPVVRRSYTKTVRGGGTALILPHSQVLSITSVTPILTAAPAVTIADLDVPAEDGIVRHKSEQSISWGALRVVYVAGRVAIPDNLVEAALIIVKHLWETQRGASSVASSEQIFLPQFRFAIPQKAIDLMELDPAPAGVA